MGTRRVSEGKWCATFARSRFGSDILPMSAAGHLRQRDTIWKKGNVPIIGSSLPWSAAAPFDFVGKQAEQFIYFVGIFCSDVLSFAAVSLQIEQLHRWQAFFLCSRFAWGAPTTAACTKTEFPVAAADREQATDGVAY